MDEDKGNSCTSNLLILKIKLSRLKNLIFLHLSHLPMKSRNIRLKFIKMGGVKLIILKLFLLANLYVLMLIILMILK